MPELLRPRRITGERLCFRGAEVGDAEFILSLRTDPEKGRYLSPTSADAEQQREWLRNYAADESQLYFIITDRDHQSVRTVRIYDVQGDSFCWGSWILSDAAPKSAAIESTMMIYAYGLGQGFRQAHFDVRRDNMKVWQYHERLGAERVREDREDFHYVISEAAIRDFLARYEDRVPSGICISF